MAENVVIVLIKGSDCVLIIMDHTLNTGYHNLSHLLHFFHPNRGLQNSKTSPPPPPTQIVKPASTTNVTQPPASSTAPSLAAVSSAPSAYVLHFASSNHPNRHPASTTKAMQQPASSAAPSFRSCLLCSLRLGPPLLSLLLPSPLFLLPPFSVAPLCRHFRCSTYSVDVLRLHRLPLRSGN